MAINTAYKRRNAAGAFLLGSLAILPLADGTVDAKDRWQVNGFYSYAGALQTTSLNIISDAIVEPVHIADQSDSLLIKGNLEVQGDTYTDTVTVAGLTTLTGGSTTGDGTNKTDISATGTLTMSGTARVSKTDWLAIGSFKAPGTKPADYIDYGLGGGWEFSDATDDTVVITKRLSQDMDKTVAPSFKIGWGSAETSGDVVWQVEYLYITAGESLANTTPDGTVPETTTVSGTANGLNVTSIAMDAPSASDQLLKVRIKRLGADGGDTLSGTAIMVGCGFNYTSDKLGVALT